MADAEELQEHREENSGIYNEIWEATISRGIRRATDLIDAVDVEPPECLLHFTSASAISQIIPKRTLRLSRARASNDPKELDHGIKIALQEQERASSNR